MGTMSINGKTFSGKNITVKNDNVLIDGVQVNTDDVKKIEISVTGNVEKIDVDSCVFVKVNGDVGNIKTTSGDIDCGDVSGSIQTVSGDVDCKSIGGNVSTVSGDISQQP